jgi:GntR family transcriptional regulator
MVKPDTPVGSRPKRTSDIALTGSRPLDRKSFVPLYFQLAEVLKEKLEMGVWHPGERFPSERQIAEEFAVSRTVIRPALNLLVGDGSIIRIKGSGTYVTPPKRRAPVTGLVRALIDHPDKLSLNVLIAQERSPDCTVARFLDLERDPVPVTHVTAVVHIDERPICLVDSYASATLVPWLLPVAHALRSGTKCPQPGPLELTRAKVSIEGAFFGQWGASQVGVSAGDPTLMGRLVQFGRGEGAKEERPVEFARLIYRSDRTQLAIELS